MSTVGRIFNHVFINLLVFLVFKRGFREAEICRGTPLPEHLCPGCVVGGAAGVSINTPGLETSLKISKKCLFESKTCGSCVWGQDHAVSSEVVAASGSRAAGQLDGSSRNQRGAAAGSWRPLEPVEREVRTGAFKIKPQTY